MVGVVVESEGEAGEDSGSVCGVGSEADEEKDVAIKQEGIAHTRLALNVWFYREMVARGEESSAAEQTS